MRYFDDLGQLGILHGSETFVTEWLEFWKDKYRHQMDLTRRIVEKINDEDEDYTAQQMVRDALGWWTSAANIWLDAGGRMCGDKAVAWHGIPHAGFVRYKSSPDVLDEHLHTNASNVGAVLIKLNGQPFNDHLQSEVNAGELKVTLLGYVGGSPLPVGAYVGIVFDADKAPPKPLLIVDVFVLADPPAV